MNYPIIRDYKLDINQEFEVNKVVNERYVLDDEQNVFVPRHAPFFMTSLTIRDDKGQELKENTDYRIFRMMGELSALCATGVSALVEVLNPKYKELYLDYHAVGSSPLFDRSLIELINTAANDQRLIKWSNLHNRPVVYDPIQHTHLLPYDLIMFQDVIQVIDEWTNNLDKVNTTLSTLAVQLQTDLVRKYFDRNSAALQHALQRHMNQYDEHGLTAQQIGLDKVANVPTATVAQGLDGQPNMRLTPSTLQEIINRYGYTSDAFLKSNVLPISFYGNTSFIPPAIGGSFEGLGSQHEGAAMCMESDGTISFLSNHFDGRSEGLYFSIISGYPNNPQFNYQSYRYNHATLTAAGVVPNMVMQGGGGEVMMVGSTRANRWFLALTKGTLDPNFHIMCEVDVSGLDATQLVTNCVSVHLMGNYVVLIQAVMSGKTPNIGLSRKRFYRIPVSAIQTGAKVTPVAMKVSFTNLDGNSFSNSDYFVWAELVQNAQGLTTRALANFVPPINLYSPDNVLYRTLSQTSCPVPSKPGIYLLKFIASSFCPCQSATESYSFGCPSELVYEFNPETGAMTLQNPKPLPTVDASGSSKNPSQILSQYWGNTYANYLSGSFAEQCAMPLDDGNILVSGTSEAFRTPHTLIVVKTGAKSRYDAMVGRVATEFYPTLGLPSYVEGIVSPLPYSIYPNSVSWNSAGEYFNAVGQRSNGSRAMFFREVTGEYAQRSSFTNFTIPNIFSRPLSNTVYETDLSDMQPRLAVTGDAAFLAAAGITNMGLTSMGVGVQGRFWRNQHTAWAGMAAADKSVLLVRSMTEGKGSNGKWSILPTSFTTYPAAIVESLAKTLIPAAYQNTPDYTVTIADTTTISAGISSKPIVIQVAYLDYLTQTRRHVVATLRVSYNTADAKNYIVTGFTVIDKVDNAVMGSQTETSATRWPLVYANRGQSDNVCAFYYSGTTIDIAINTYYSSNHVGNAGNMGSRIVINQSDHTIVSGGGYVQNWEGNSNIVAVPKLGMATKFGSMESGSTAELLYISATGQSIGRISCYPDPAWSVFFQTEVAVIFNGKTYTLPAGMTDLRSIKANPANTTFYLYARLVNGVAQYAVSETKTFDTPYNIWIGTVITNATQIIDIARFNVLLLNGARVSEVKRGGSIPSVTGAIGEQGQMAWLRSSEVIQG